MYDSYVLRICSDKTAFEAKATSPMKLDLLSISDAAAKRTGMSLRVSLPAILLLEGEDGRIVNIYPSGRLLLRKFPSLDAARETVNLLAPLVYGSETE